MSVKSRIAELNARLADTLTEKGVEADASETTTALVAKVADIEQGGEITPTQALQWWARNCTATGTVGSAEITEIPDLEFTIATSAQNFLANNQYVTKVGNLRVPNAGTSGNAIQALIRYTEKVEEVGVIYAPTAKYANYVCAENTALVKIGGLYAPNATNWQSTFSTNRKLVEITEPLDMGAATYAAEVFNHCGALKEVRFVEGSLHVSMSFNYSDRLSVASLQSIIAGLADLTGQTSPVLTLTNNSKSLLTEEQIATITGKNWTLA